MRYLMVDGHGDPNTSPAYRDAIGALYPVAYKLKFISKRELGRDYVVPPLEGLWWADDMDTFTVARDKSRWNWTLMLMVPGWIDDGSFPTAIGQAGAKDRPRRLDDIRLETLSEGLCVQTLHVGPFDAEGPVLERMHHGFIPEHGLRMAGLHHEIYLSDARRAAPNVCARCCANPSPRCRGPIPSGRRWSGHHGATRTLPEQSEAAARNA
nr:GyrI-like domain-containing protein [Tessaracoccus coleopterorum]